MILPADTDGATLDREREVSRVQQQADQFCRAFFGGRDDDALQFACELRSRLDYLARELSLAAVARPVSPLEAAEIRLAEILAHKRKGGAA